MVGRRAVDPARHPGDPGLPEGARRGTHRARAGDRGVEATAEADHPDRAAADAGAGARLHRRRVHLHLWHDGARRLARLLLLAGVMPDRPRLPLGRRRRASVGHGRPQEHVHDRLRVHGDLRLRLLRDAQHRDADADLHRHRAVADPGHDDVRTRGGADRGSFTPRLRYSGASLGYQLASIIAGGPSPFIATWLFATYGSTLPIALYILVCAIIGIIATALLTDYTNKEISAEAHYEEPL